MTLKGKSCKFMNIALYISWILLFAGGLNLTIAATNITWVAIRINLVLISLLFFIKLSRGDITNFQVRLSILGYLLIMIQCIGLFNNFSMRSLVTMGLVGLICIYILFTIGVDYSNVKTSTFHLIYYIVLLLFLFDLSLNNGGIIEEYTVGMNTAGGMIVFLTLINIVLRESRCMNKKNRYLIFDYFSLFLIMPLLMFTRARSAGGTALIVVTVFFLLSIFQL